MNTISKEYTKQIKALFPVNGKPEKKYVNALVQQVEEICEEESITSIEQLYEKFGKPEDIVREYFSRMDTEEVVQRIKKTHFLKFLITAIIIAAIAVSVYAATSTILYQKAYQEALDNMNGYWVDEIE